MRVNAVVDVTSRNVVTLYVSGEVDEHETDELCDMIVANACPATPTVALDLTGITFLGSGGINAIVRAWKLLEARGLRLCIDDCSPIVERVLDLTGVRAQFARSTDEVAADDGCVA